MNEHKRTYRDEGDLLLTRYIVFARIKGGKRYIERLTAIFDSDTLSQSGARDDDSAAAGSTSKMVSDFDSGLTF